MQFELTRLDLGHVQHAIDQLQKMRTGFMDQAGIFLIARTQRAEHFPGHHFRKTDNGVQRRAQLMTHIGQEARLGAGGIQRRVARLHQRMLK